MDEDIRLSFWRSGLVALGGLIGFVLIMGRIVQPALEGTPLIVVGLVIALVPAVLWLTFFYQQDRKEPEPKRLVIRVFLLGALLASGAGLPIVRDFFRLQEWPQENALLRLVGLILIAGFTHEFLKFVAVRYTVFPTPDFGNRVDGMLYGIAAGLGYATVLNLEYVLTNQGVVLFVGGIRMVDTALAQAGFAAITGYFLAGAKHGDRPLWWVPTGLAIAATLNGLVAFLREEVSIRGLTYDPLNALFLSMAFVVVSLGILFVLVRRAEWREVTGG